MYSEYARQMNHTASAKERKKIVNEVCRLFGIGEAKAYKELKLAGWESGRKKRVDAGTTEVPIETLQIMSNLAKKGIRKNGKVTLPINVLRSIMQENGYEIPVSDSRLRELLRLYNMSIEDAKVQTPHQRMRSEYPNQIHFADPSVCLTYFAPEKKQKFIGDDELYKNKNFLEGKVKCWRYVLTDHYSSSICVRYYAAMGETAVNMYDFLLYAWGQKADPLYVFHGLPDVLVWDCGSANISKPVTAALEALRVRTIPHLPGNPRAKGQVEKANDIVETQFESRLRIEPVNSVEELNEAAERWAAAYNANLIKGLDTCVNRGGQKRNSRTMLWQHISTEQLRELPDADVCRQIFNSGIQSRKVGGDLAVSVHHPKAKQVLRYSLAHLPGILIGADVNVQPILVDEELLVKVSYEHEGESVSYEVTPIAYNAQGFDVDAPVYGVNYKREPDTIREQRAKEINNLSIPAMAAHSFINAESPFIKQREGERVVISETSQTAVHEILISHFEALKRIAARIGYPPDGFMERAKAEWPEGVPSSLIDDIAKEYEAEKDSRLVAFN